MHNTDTEMERIFDDKKLAELETLFKTGQYTKTQLAGKYKCSVTTVCLWLNPNEEARTKKFQSRKTRTKCDCGERYTTHKKCRICRTLTHSEDELQIIPNIYRYGKQTRGTKVCDSCYEKYVDQAIIITRYSKIGNTVEANRLTILPYSLT